MLLASNGKRPPTPQSILQGPGLVSTIKNDLTPNGQRPSGRDIRPQPSFEIKIKIMQELLAALAEWESLLHASPGQEGVGLVLHLQLQVTGLDRPFLSLLDFHATKTYTQPQRGNTSWAISQDS